ncbi:hypothetical protein BRE01_67560 [Brevibacillus reuszeri]|uniref:Uncharacterized protein n=1 Tax=Brevibacillus reuszeri TaxID=54915 RepID=A0A0K9YNB3_9BACL|nr:hypothetical protein [Brevibacillus reuszeri]KNB70204.1 hypothetical protein ADS79_14640 [Brevibacillus reuszeri]GED73054.1 hypothetical protein BRE01_67560 [Brevibacillus reuszeri]
MKLKCNYCDPKNVKSIDSETDDFIRDNDTKKYYHTDCYMLHLKTRKRLTDEEIETRVSERVAYREQEIREMIDKNNFFQWLMNYYDAALPSYFYMKVQSIRTGKHELVKDPVNYETLLDIYQHMESYLNKIAAKKQMSVSSRMNYDLAVVIGNMGDYRRYKAKQLTANVEAMEIETRLEDGKIVQEIHRQRREKNKRANEFDITDVMDELLL